MGFLQDLLGDLLNILGSGTPSVQGYEFTVSNGQVTGIQQVFGSFSFHQHVPSDATFALSAGSVTETITQSSTTEVIQYTANPTDPSLYNELSDTVIYDNPSTSTGSSLTLGYTFTVTSGAVTAIQQVLGHGTHTVSFNLPFSPSTIFSISGGMVTETSVLGNTVDATQYVEPAGGTIYAISSTSTTNVQPGTATTLLSVNPYDRAEFTINGGGTVTQVQSVSPSGTTSVVTPGSHVAYSQLAPGFVEETTTYGTHSNYDVYFDGGAGSIYTEVAHGSGSSVDLVGLKAQLAQLPPGLEAIV